MDEDQFKIPSALAKHKFAPSKKADDKTETNDKIPEQKPKYILYK